MISVTASISSGISVTASIGNIIVTKGADVVITDNLANPTAISKAPGTTYTCTSQITTYNYSMSTGSETIFRVGDDAYIQQLLFANIQTGYKNSLVDFFTLKDNNLFGNKNRFTAINGSQTITNNYFIDNFTGMGWVNILFSLDTLENQYILTTAANYSGFSDFFIPNKQIISDVFNTGIMTSLVGYSALSYLPFNFARSFRCWTSSSLNYAPSYSYDYSEEGVIGYEPKTSLRQVIICRKHF